MGTPILHVINGEFYAGAERVQDLLALRLDAMGYEVGFACVKPDQFPEKRVAKGVPLYLVPMRSQFDIKVGFELARIIRERGYMLVHTHTPRAALVGRIASLLTRVPMVHHVHSPTSRDTESLGRNFINSLIERITRIGISRVVPVSKSLEAHLMREGVKPGKIRMVANGVPTPGALPVRDVPGSEWVIGSVALFRPRKGIEILIEALAILHQKGFRVRLRAVGEFETEAYRLRVIDMAKRNGVESFIDWIGFSRNVDSELAIMDVLVLPSLFGEGMPMVVLEAMALGVPVIASSVEGIPEVLENNVSGLLVTPGDVTGLANALARLIADRSSWTEMREAAYLKQCAEFSDHAMAKRMAEVYREILGE